MGHHIHVRLQPVTVFLQRHGQCWGVAAGSLVPRQRYARGLRTGRV